MKKVIVGAVSQETAYTISDYPYSFNLRCQIRLWVETAVKGAGKGKMRVMSQTSNPKKGGWNKPKNEDVYKFIALIYLDSENHFHCAGLHEYSQAKDVVQFKLDFYDQLPLELQQKFDKYEAASRKGSPKEWEEFEKK